MISRKWLKHLASIKSTQSAESVRRENERGRTHTTQIDDFENVTDKNNVRLV